MLWKMNQKLLWGIKLVQQYKFSQLRYSIFRIFIDKHESNQNSTIFISSYLQIRRTRQPYQLKHNLMQKQNDQEYSVCIQQQDYAYIREKIDNALEKCPRLYFLPESQILKSLEKFQNISFFQSLVQSLTQGVHRIEINEQQEISAVIDNLNFKLPLISKIQAKDRRYYQVLENLLRAVQISTHANIQQAFHAFPKMDIIDWLKLYSNQAVVSVYSVICTKETEQAIFANSFNQCLQRRQAVLKSLIKQLRFPQQLVPSEIVKIQNLIIKIYQNCKKIKDLEDAKAKSTRKCLWNLWKNQVRHYWRNNELQIECGQSLYKYQYEFLGSYNSLMITNVSESLFQSLMNSWNSHYFLSPQGKAGTGKTQSVKELARTLGQYCVVFNCSDQVDHILFQKILKGVTKNGCWLCLDEFNRINISCIQKIYEKIENLHLMKAGKRIIEQGSDQRIRNCFIAFTMNPGYAGRTCLPHKYCQIVKGFSMQAPDVEVLIKIMLMHQGFLEAEALSQGLKQFYQYAASYFSKQDFYDFGLRSFKFVILRAGKILRQNLQIKKQTYILIQGLQIVKSRLIKQDIPLFSQFIEDIFNIKPKYAENKLQQYIEKAICQNKLVCSPAVIEKIVQLQMNMKERQGTAILGYPLSGKTTIINILKSTLESIPQRKRSIEIKTIFPKYYTCQELYGSFERQENCWKDGILPLILRKAVNDKTKDHWILFKGVVDAIWVQGMNTVLDDNKTLFLPNGDQIAITDNIKFVFEIQNARVVSPATVSRLGIVFIPKDLVCQKERFENWIERNKNIFNKETTIKLGHLFERIYIPCSKFVLDQINLDSCHVYKSFNTVLMCLIQQTVVSSEKTRIQNIFIFAIILCLGNLLKSANRVQFDTLLKKITAMKYQHLSLPKQTSIYQLQLCLEKNEWSKIQLRQQEQTLFYQNLQQRVLLSKLLIKNKIDIIIDGQQNSGKTHFLNLFSGTFGKLISKIEFDQSLISQKSKIQKQGKFQPMLLIDNWDCYFRDRYGSVCLHNIFMSKFFEQKEISKPVIIAATKHSCSMSQQNFSLSYFYPIYLPQLKKNEMEMILNFKIKNSQCGKLTFNLKMQEQFVNHLSTLMVQTMLFGLQIRKDYKLLTSIVKSVFQQNYKEKLSKEQLLKMFVFEIMRTLYDCLGNQLQRDQLEEIVTKKIDQKFPLVNLPKISQISLNSTLYLAQTATKEAIAKMKNKEYMTEFYPYKKGYQNLQSIIYQLNKIDKHIMLFCEDHKIASNFVKLGCSLTNLPVHVLFETQRLQELVSQIKEAVIIINQCGSIEEQNLKKFKKAIETATKPSKNVKLVFLMRFEDGKKYSQKNPFINKPQELYTLWIE